MSGQASGDVTIINNGFAIPAPVLSSSLQDKLATAPADDAIPVLLSFTEDQDTATLQGLKPDCPSGKWDDDAVCKGNKDGAKSSADALAQKRLRKLQKYLRKLGFKYGKNVKPGNDGNDNNGNSGNDDIGAFAIGNIFIVSLKPAQVQALLDLTKTAGVKTNDDDYLQLRVVEDPFHPLVAQGVSGTCTNTDSYTFDDPTLSRMATTADPYSSVAGITQRIGLIDQGINTGHTLLAGRLGYYGDCSTTSSGCVGSTCGGNCCRRMVGSNAKVDNCTNYGDPTGGTTGAHGTACASLLAGNANCLGTYRGASNYVIDFFRAYYTIDFVNAFQAAVMSGDSIVSTSLGVNSAAEALSSVSLAADSAYDAGLIIFSAAGNFGCSPTYNGGCTTSWGYTSSGTCTAPISGSIMSPANAHKVVAVGAYSAAQHSVSSGPTYTASSTALRSVAPMCYSGRGPTKNGRIKPDIMGPTGIEAAYTATSTSDVAYFSGTSAATPNVAGAFASFMAYRKANKGASGTVPTKGEFMASIMAAGENFGLPNNNVGAGAYRPGAMNATTIGNGAQNSWATFGFSSLTQTASIALNTTTTTRPIKCAIWWPQSATAAKLSDFDLALIGPSGTTVATSALTTSVWEKVSVVTPTVGTYTLKITVKTLASLTQQVHTFCFF